MSFSILNSTTREEWLEQRKGYITATDIASIRTGSEKAFRELWEKKHKGETFRGNRFTEWGNLREPEIAKWVKSIDACSQLEPNDQLHVKDGTKHACTPDMVGKGRDGNLLSCQIKTVGKSRYFEDCAHMPAEYKAQVEWEMYVLGIEKCAVCWEERVDTGDGFEPGGCQIEFVESDPKLRATLIEIAERFEAYEPDEIEEGEDSFMIRALIQELKLAIGERRSLAEQDKKVKADIERIQGELLAELGEDPRRISYPEGMLEVEAGRVSNRFDRKAFAAEYPDLEEKFIVQSVGKPSVSFKEAS